MPTITQLEYLVAVDEEMHFGRAARRCFVSQPSLSAQIQKLEEELDQVIFDRSKKPILVTEVGRDVIQQARVVLKEHRRIQSIAMAGATTPKGDFSLAVIPTLSPYLIPRFVPEFAKNYPDVMLKLRERQTDDIIRGLLDDTLDAGLLVTPLADDRLIERHLFFEPFHLYVSPGHPLQKVESVSEQDLSTGDLWLLGEGHCFRDQTLRICSNRGQKKVLPNIDFESGNLETLRHMVRDSKGYTLLPQLALSEIPSLERSEHVRPFCDPQPTREVSLVYSRSFFKEKIVSALEHCILDHLADGLTSLKRQDVDIIEFK